MKSIRQLTFAIIILASFLVSCRKSDAALTDNLKTLAESPVIEISLSGPASESRSEISGMAWCGSNLILLPQYPDRFEEGDADHVFSIPKDAIKAYLSGETTKAIEPQLVPFDGGDLERTIRGFEGFESVVFNDSQFYVTIEARTGGEMAGYLVSGQVEGACAGLTLDPDSLQSLPLQANISNMSHETLVFFEEELYVMYEANGLNVNPNPVAHVFDAALGEHTEVEMPQIEYRITDATEADQTGAFWAINYFFPGDEDLLPAEDQIALIYGIGLSHFTSETVERIIKLRVDKNGIVLVDQEPIYLELLKDDSRNWEGIVKFGDGFLLVTDKFPTTILAFIEGIQDSQD
jgi:hypothetical protein